MSETEVAISDAEVAAGLAEQAAKPYDPMQNETVDKAAEVFGNTLPRIKAVAKNLKGGALYRVFKNVMEYPLQDGEPKFQSKVEQELFILCLAVTHAKNTMIQAMGAARAMEERRLKDAEAAAMGELKTLAPEEMVKETNNATDVAEENMNG